MYQIERVVVVRTCRRQVALIIFCGIKLAMCEYFTPQIKASSIQCEAETTVKGRRICKPGGYCSLSTVQLE